MTLKTILTCSIGFLLASCATTSLESLDLDGPELHASLVTAPLEVLEGSPASLAVESNPCYSTDAEFVEAIARRASQGGALNGTGVRAAMLAVYVGEEKQLGIYGLEAASTAHADRIEGIVRGIWSHNEGLDIAQVHRSGRIILVVWATRESPSYWQAANASLARHLGAS